MVEYETFDGFIPEYRIFDAGLIPLRDGSLKHGGIEPYEYATIPMSGKDTLGMIKEQCNLLNTHCKLSASQSSLHVHQGTHPFSIEYASAYYKLVVMLQNEIYNMFPEYVRHSAPYKGGKDYCSPLPTITELRAYYRDSTGTQRIPNGLSEAQEIFMYLYYYLSDIDIKDSIKTSNEAALFLDRHPSDPENRHKWYIRKRYSICNFVSYLFNRKHTIEWRLHTPTFNYTKIKYYLLILEAISKFVEDNTNLILDKLSKISLEEVINNCYGNNTSLSNTLNAYVKYRTNNFTVFKTDSNGKIINPEVNNDSNFKM